jgi:tRNA-specific 2-thiouridylase
MSKVFVGISGGVDSSVAAFLLKEQGYEVEGMFMINWHDTTGTLAGDCPWNDDLIFAGLVARKLDIPLHTVDFSVEYRKRVVDYMFNEYKHGRTPNPDVLCNREIKFDLFLKQAQKLGADFIATGHYCRKEILNPGADEIYRLLAGTDPGKEQSYFLCQLSQQQLKHALFPIGHLYKSEIRKIAEEQDLATAKRKDSQGICFVGKVDLPEFLQQKLEPKEGSIIEIETSIEINFPAFTLPVDIKALKILCTAPVFNESMGKEIGKHKGAHYYTIGQRKGLNVGGKAEPLFVLATNTVSNTLYVGQGHNHPGLNRPGLFISKEDIHWIRPDLALHPGQILSCIVRIRYRQPLQKAYLIMEDEGLYIIFDEAQRGVTPGQFAAWYLDDELFGSGIIS